LFRFVASILGKLIMQPDVRVFSLVVCIAIAAPCLAVGPIQGNYGTANTLPLDGTMLAGRGSDSWADSLDGETRVSNVLNLQSWTGAALGTEWVFDCSVSSSQIVIDNTVGGSGYVQHKTTYEPGRFFLSKDGPWGDSVNDLTGRTTHLLQVTTVALVSGNPVAADERAFAEGFFDGSSCYLTLVIARAVVLGDTAALSFPVGYPALLDTDCSTARADGSWSDITTISMNILCLEFPSAVAEKQWSQVKALYQ
jgi:hypothetical protein